MLIVTAARGHPLATIWAFWIGPSIRSRFPPPLWPLRAPFRRSYNDLPIVVPPQFWRPCRFFRSLAAFFRGYSAALFAGSLNFPRGRFFSNTWNASGGST